MLFLYAFPVCFSTFPFCPFSVFLFVSSSLHLHSTVTLFLSISSSFSLSFALCISLYSIMLHCLVCVWEVQLLQTYWLSPLHCGCSHPNRLLPFPYLRYMFKNKIKCYLRFISSSLNYIYSPLYLLIHEPIGPQQSRVA